MRLPPCLSVVVVGISVACDSTPLIAPSSAGPSFAISDGSHGGNAHFYFLPPMVKAPAFTGTFDATRSPEVRICVWAGSCGPLVAGFTMTSGTGSETVRLADDYYAVNWHSGESGLDPTATYRISVHVAGNEIGYADVDLVSSGKELKNVNTGEFIPLLDGRTLPIRFRIEQGAVTQPNLALSFNGTSQFVEVPDAASLDLGATWTLEAWVKPSDVGRGEFQHVISKWDGGCDASYTLEVHTGRLRSAVHNCTDATQAVETFGNLANNVWQHVAITLDNSTLSLYINGTLDRTVAGSQIPMNSTRPLSFGHEGPPFNGWFYAGLIDEIRIWNVVRGPGDIAGAMNQRLQGPQPGLVGRWGFDEGVGDVANDASGNGNNGRLGTTVGPDAGDPTWTADAAPVS